MLTGDNPFTAVNIAHSCGLIEKNQKTFIVTQKTRKEIKEEFEKIKEHIKKNKKKQRSESNYYVNSSESNGNEYISSSDSSGNSEKTEFCLVITGDALTIVQRDEMRVESINGNNNNNNNNNQNDKNNSDSENKKKINENNDKEKILENKPENKNPLSSPENQSGSEKSNDTVKDFKRRPEYKDSKLMIAEEQKEYNADSEKENSSRSKSINNNSDENESINCNNKNKEKNNKENKKEEKKSEKESKSNKNSKNIKKESSKNFDNEGIEEGSLLNLFLDIITSTNTVVCSRVSPKQKADLISMVKKHEKENMTTLAIGDGANDVNMITAADVGIGIMGNEGQQAARASDYVIGQFSFLKRLLFVHGREAQRKNAFAIGYILWKNFLYVIPMIM
jgi:magnesium-transporting ATPase (P-type)